MNNIEKIIDKGIEDMNDFRKVVLKNGLEEYIELCKENEEIEEDSSEFQFILELCNLIINNNHYLGDKDLKDIIDLFENILNQNIELQLWDKLEEDMEEYVSRVMETFEKEIVFSETINGLNLYHCETIEINEEDMVESLLSSVYEDIICIYVDNEEMYITIKDINYNTNLDL
jgi:hypothetical protein